MKQKQIIFWSVTALLVLTLVLFFYFKNRSKIKIDPDQTPSSEEISVFPLKKGSQGSEVRRLQRHLNHLVVEQNLFHFIPLAEDGIFGPLTEGMCYIILKKREITESEFKALNI